MKTFLAKKIQACPPWRIGSFVWLRRIFDFKIEEHKKNKGLLRGFTALVSSQ